MNYEFDVYSPVGAFKRTVLRSQTAMRQSGYRGSLTPDAGCREATWQSVQSLLRLLPLDAVRVFAWIGGVRTPIFFGELRQGGNVQDKKGEQCVLRGLNVRFREVPMAAVSYSTRDAGFLFRDALRDAITAGYFGTPSLITVADADFPALNFTLSVEATNQQDLESLLTKILEQSGQAGILECGVRPDGSAYLKVRKANDLTDVFVLPATTDIDPQVPVQEVVATQVFWYVEQRGDGKGWVTSISSHPDVALYGPRLRRATLDSGVKPYITADFAATANDGTGEVTLDAAQRAPLISGVSGGFELVISAEADSANVVLTQTLTTGARRYSFQATWRGGDSAGNKVVVTTPDRATTYLALDLKAQSYSPSGSAALLTGTFAPTLTVLYDLPPGTVISFQGTSLPGTTDAAQRRVSMAIQEAHPQGIDTALLGSMAQAYYQLPVREPGRLQTPTLLAPATLRGHVQAGTYLRPVEAWEYTIEGGPRGGLATRALTEQADDPAAVARNQLIRYRDQQATLNAVTART